MADDWWNAFPAAPSPGIVVEPGSPAVGRKVTAEASGAELGAAEKAATLPYAGRIAAAEAAKKEADALAAKLAADKAQDAANKRQRDMGEAQNELLNVIKAARKAKKLSQEGWFATGAGSETAYNMLGGSPARDVRALLTTIGGNVAFDRLQRMRQESPTGGALGGIAVQELEMLKSTIAAMDPTQSDKQFQENMDQIIRTYERLYGKLGGDPAALEAAAPVTATGGEPVAPGEESEIAVTGDLSWPEALGEGLMNLPSSTGKLIGDTAYALSIGAPQTISTIGKLAVGALSKVLPGQPFDETTIDALGKFYADRYGSEEGFKQAIAEDPAGVLADAATILTGGGAAAARGAGTVGRVGGIAHRAGRAIDPVNATLRVATEAVPAAGRLAKKSVGFAASQAAGRATGIGPEAVQEAYSAGRKGGASGHAFVEHMRNGAPIEDVVQMARDAVANLRTEASDAYRSGMVDVSNDATILDFSDIDRALANARKLGYYKGEVKNAGAVRAWNDINDIVNEWKALDPAEYHTPEGMDALKQRIGDTVEKYTGENDRRALRAATGIYGSVKDSIAKQVPTYAKTMKQYEEAQTTLRDIEKTMSTGRNAQTDTAIRKLQSVLRNNANTNYGRRADMARQLEAAGASELFPALAGQAASSWQPRGLAGVASLVGALPTFGLSLAATSPRLAGEAAYAAGRGARGVENLMRPATQPLARGMDKLLSKYEMAPERPLYAAAAAQGLQGAEDELAPLLQRYAAPPQAAPAPKAPSTRGTVSAKFPYIDAVFGQGAQPLADGSVLLPDGEVVPAEQVRDMMSTVVRR